MTKLLIKALKIKNFFIFVSIFTYLVLNFNSVAEGNNTNSSKILWKKIKRNKINNNQIKWEKYDGAIDLDIKKEYPYEIKFVNENNTFQESTELEPYLPLNYYLEPGEITTSINWKSAFSGGTGGGTGHQNISARIDYGIYKDVTDKLKSGYFRFILDGKLLNGLFEISGNSCILPKNN